MDGKPLEQTTASKGYLEITRRWSGSATIVLDLAMPVLFIQADPHVRELAGKLAIRRGPLIYCFEACDNGPDLHLVTLNGDAETTAEFRQDLMEAPARSMRAGTAPLWAQRRAGKKASTGWLTTAWRESP